MDFAEDFGTQVNIFLCIKFQDHPLTSVWQFQTIRGQLFKASLV